MNSENTSVTNRRCIRIVRTGETAYVYIIIFDLYVRNIWKDVYKRQALSDTNRLEIVRMLSDGEKCGCKILDKFNITQPTLSHHMKILVDCGIVNDRKEGKRHYYSLTKTVIREASSFVEALGR